MRRLRSRPRATSRRRPRLRIVVALTALLMAAALPAQAQVDAADPVLSIVVDETRAPVTIAWSQLAGQLDGDANVKIDGRALPAGLWLERALTAAGVPPQVYSSVTSADGTAVIVSKEELLLRSAYLFRAEDGTLQLVKFEAGGKKRNWARSADGTLTLRLGREASVIAMPAVVTDGGEVVLHATLPPQLDPAGVTYEWEFNDGGKVKRTSEPSVSHVFKARNDQETPYYVTVTFLVDGRGFGDMLPPGTTVTVKLDPSKVYRGFGADAGNGDARSAGRGRHSVRDGEDEERAPTQSPSSGGGGGTGGGDWSGGGDTTYTPPVSSPPVTPAATPTPPPTPKPRPQREPRRAPEPTPAPAGETVDGYLLASADVELAAAGGSAAEQARAEAARLPQPDDDPLQVPTAVWVAVGLLALVVLGWGLESRTTLPYFRP